MCVGGDHTLYLQNLVLLRKQEDQLCQMENQLLELLILNRKAVKVHERRH